MTVDFRSSSLRYVNRFDIDIYQVLTCRYYCSSSIQQPSSRTLWLAIHSQVVVRLVSGLREIWRLVNLMTRELDF